MNISTYINGMVVITLDIQTGRNIDMYIHMQIVIESITFYISLYNCF